MLALIYRRVSTEDQARRGFSLPEQWEACRSRAAALGAEQFLDFADEGAPGDVLTRPALAAVRDRLRAGGVGMVVVLDPDRLARNLTHQLILTEEIERSGARLEFVNFEWQQTPEGRLFYALRGAVSEYEKAKILERTARGRLGKARQGKRTHNIPVYGYRQIPDGLAIEEAEARWVRLMYQWAATGREGAAAVARRLNELGVPAPRGGVWRPAVVRRILTSQTYKGTLFQNRWDAAGVRHNRFRPAGERVRRTERAPSAWLPMAVPAIVPAELWESVQGHIEQARRRHCGVPGHPYLLRGLLICGLCRRPVRGSAGYGRGRRLYRYYVCGGGCGLGSVAAGPLEQAVWEQVATLMEQELGRCQAWPDPGADQEQRAVAAELESLRAEQARIVRLASRGLIEMNVAEEHLARVRERRERLLGAATMPADAGAGPAGAGAAGAAVLENPPEAPAPLAPPLTNLPPDLRRQIVRALVDRGTLLPGEICLHIRLTVRE